MIKNIPFNIIDNKLYIKYMANLKNFLIFYKTDFTMTINIWLLIYKSLLNYQNVLIFIEGMMHDLINNYYALLS